MKQRLNSLQVLRAVACIGIIICHTKICLYLGTWGVSLFFVLSGFLFTYNYFEKDISSSFTNSILFSLKRIAKLYPLYICAVIALLPLNGLQNHSISENISTLAIHILLLQSWFSDIDIVYGQTGVGWYLSSILFIFVLIPYTLRFIKQCNNKKILLIIGMSLILLQILGTYYTPFNMYTFPISRYVDVCIGCIMGFFYLNRKNKGIRHEKVKYTFYEITAIAITIFTNYLNAKGKIGDTYAYLPSTIMLVYVFALNRGYISHILTNRFSVFIGNISGYIYLIHMVVMRWLIVIAKYIFHTEIDLVSLNILTIILTVFSAYLWKQIISLRYWRRPQNT